MGLWMVGLVVLAVIIVVVAFLWAAHLGKCRKLTSYERGLKMVPLLIHLPPSTDDIQGNGRDERDVTNETISQAQVMYSIIASTVEKGFSIRVFGQKHLSFEIISSDNLIKYYAVVPSTMVETVKQAVISAYPTARLEETQVDNIFGTETTTGQIAGGELVLKKDFVYPISTYEDSQRDASLGILHALSSVKAGEGLAVQILLRPIEGDWTKISEERVQNLRDGKKPHDGAKKFFTSTLNLIKDLSQAFFHPPDEHEKDEKVLTNLQQEEIAAIEQKTKFPGFETLIRVVASANSRDRSEAILSGVVAAFSQFDSPTYNGFKYEMLRDMKKLAVDYIFRVFPQGTKDNILNSVELASIFHLPSQSAIPTSSVERQATKQVDGPAKLVTDGVLLGVNEFRGVQKEIRLSENDRRRHTYVIGATGMGKSVFLTNIAYQDMCDGRGFAFIDPHGDAVETLLSKVPEERIDDIVYFDPSDMEHPIGMNMFEWTTEDQKDFIVQEGISMLTSLFDPNNQGFFGPRGQHMFRNAALLLMSDPNGATFIDIPQCFTDPEFVKSKLKYVKDKAVYDYWTKEFPQSQKSNDAGEVITWFASKWGPFLSNTTMRNILGQAKSGFNIREIMDNKKIFLVNLSKGKLGDINSNLLGMILVMKFQQAAMSRADIPESERQDFCLFVDEFQNFATESFESILSEARKYKLNLLLANQFMTQLTDKIREAILGNVGTIMCGRVGVTDAELMEKAFVPVFNAEDLHKQGNFQAIATVMMYNLPTSPFTMRLLPPMGESNPELLARMKDFTAMKYGKTRAEVEKEINDRWKRQAELEKVNANSRNANASGGNATANSQVGNANFRTANANHENSNAFSDNGNAKNASVGSQEAHYGPSGTRDGFLQAWRAKRAEIVAKRPKTTENTNVSTEQSPLENNNSATLRKTTSENHPKPQFNTLEPNKSASTNVNRVPESVVDAESTSIDGENGHVSDISAKTEPKREQEMVFKVR